MPEDKYWYEAAFVTGVTNALNVAADGLARVYGNDEPEYSAADIVP